MESCEKRSPQRDAAELLLAVPRHPGLSGGHIYRQGSQARPDGADSGPGLLWYKEALNETNLPLDAELLATTTRSLSCRKARCLPPPQSDTKHTARARGHEAAQVPAAPPASVERRRRRPLPARRVGRRPEVLAALRQQPQRLRRARPRRRRRPCCDNRRHGTGGLRRLGPRARYAAHNVPARALRLNVDAWWPSESLGRVVLPACARSRPSRPLRAV